jgi:hypothetical protein
MVANPFVPPGAYRAGLQTALSKILPHLSRREKEDLVYKKLMLEQQAADEAKYVQSASELTVCAWFANVASQAGVKFEYELVIAQSKDVDCSILYEGHKFNIEVKCADYQKQKSIVAGSELVIHGLGRLEDYNPTVARLQNLLGETDDRPFISPAHHMDLKMKDYLLSAQGKFGTSLEPESLNILFVCVDDQMDMTKWIAYLEGPQGLFTRDSFEQQQKYNNVDMVVLSNLYHRHSDLERKSKISDHWNLSKAFNFAVINPATTKSPKIFSAFSELVSLENADLIAYLKSGSIPDGLEGALGLSYYVAEQKKQGVHKFQGYPVEKQAKAIKV